MIVRALEAADRRDWEPLWRGYQDFYAVALAADVTDKAWARMLDPGEPVHGLGAFEGDGQLLGIAHYVFHRSTWSASNYCYLNDLFTVATARRRGVGRALIERVMAEAAREGATRVYWLTHEDNREARLLYDRVAERSGLIQYRRNLPVGGA